MTSPSDISALQKIQLQKKEIEGLRKSDARFKRKSRKLADEIGNLIERNASKAYEIKDLEDTLAWIYRYIGRVGGESGLGPQESLLEIRKVIGERIPRRLERGHGVTASLSSGSDT